MAVSLPVGDVPNHFVHGVLTGAFVPRARGLIGQRRPAGSQFTCWACARNRTERARATSVGWAWWDLGVGSLGGIFTAGAGGIGIAERVLELVKRVVVVSEPVLGC